MYGVALIYRGRRMTMENYDKELAGLENEIRSKMSDTQPVMNRTEPAKRDGANVTGSSDHELLQFFIGFLLFGGGIYWVLNSFTVSSTWGSGYWSLFGMRMPMGVMLIPLLVGIGLLFFLDKKVIGGFVCALGLLVIVISLLTSITFHAVRSSLYVYVLMFGMIAAGAGLLIKTLFKGGKKKE